MSINGSNQIQDGSTPISKLTINSQDLDFSGASTFAVPTVTDSSADDAAATVKYVKDSTNGAVVTLSPQEIFTNGDGSQTTFTVTGFERSTTKELRVFRNGLKCREVSSSPGVNSYTASAGSSGSPATITFGTAPASDDELEIVWLNPSVS